MWHTIAWLGRNFIIPILFTAAVTIGWKLNEWQIISVLIIAITFSNLTEDTGILSGRLPKDVQPE